MNKSIHFVGIKGVGMTPLAIIAKQAGFSVTGCDVASEFITDKVLKENGIIALHNFSPEHIHGNDMIITTGAHGGFDNPEVRQAKIQKIPVLTQGEATGIFMNGKIFGRTEMEGISIAGCHGKTTATAMIATVFTLAGLDPSYLIGTGEVASLSYPGHYGKGKFFIAEADEYATEPQYDKTPKFMWQFPQFALLTNIELDHPDMYTTIDDMVKAYINFTKNVKKDGVLILCGDDPYLLDIKSNFDGRVLTYGFQKDNDFIIKDVSIKEGLTKFQVVGHDTEFGEFTIQVIGEHNALNATGVIALSLEAGLPLEKIREGLSNFKGTKRRSEYIKTLLSGAIVFDDYAHHPTEIKKTLAAFKKSYPGKKIICIFQPHTYSRTKIFQEEFTHAFSDADVVFLVEIFSSKREEVDPTISSQILVEKMSSFHQSVYYFPSIDSVKEYLKNNLFDSETLFVTMGAGDVYKIFSS